MARLRVKIYTDTTGYVEAELFDDLSPNTFKRVVEALPIEGVGYRWGDEVYFSTNVKVGEENAKEVVEKGTIAYWPPGKAICIFWGPTPASRTKNEIRPASPVNIIGKVMGDPTVFSRFKSGSIVRIEKA
ncbi:MAG: cyclophilin-like family protein [Ignisphaera sp.]|uniref:Cyclophilin TM1367-like domain-containing protein n=1 Tax=Ignisphaera aggregans TaxID=334771 RepID=A0A7C4JK37_9CREN